jgi:hypothetical protein
MSTVPAPYSVRIRLAILGLSISWSLSIVFFYLGLRSIH